MGWTRIRSGLAVLGLVAGLAGFTGLPARAAVPSETEAIAKAGEASTLVASGRLDEASALLDEALTAADLPPDRRGSMLNDRGLVRWRLGRLKDAIDDFNAAIGFFPELAASYNNRGNVLLALNMTEEAIRDFNRAILLAPNYVAAFNNRAIAHMQTGDFDAAMADFSKAAELAPISPAPLNGRGRALFALGRPYGALRDYSRAIALDPGYRPGYRNRAQVLASIGRLDDAVGDLESAIEAAPEDASLLLARGHALIDQKSYQAALRDYNKALSIDANSSIGFAERGYVLAHLGDQKEALADFATAIGLDHRNVAAYVYRAWTQAQTKSAELGLADVERALKLDPKNADAYRVRGDILAALGRSEAAIADYRQAAAIDPDDTLAAEALQKLTGEEPAGKSEVIGGDFEEWSIVVDNGGRYFAISDKISRLEVPLEMGGDGVPRIVDWDARSGAFKGIGLLRYLAGKTAEGEEIEQGVLIDVSRRSVIAIEPYRTGKRLATWTWDEGQGSVTVRGLDGVTSEYKLRTGRGSERVATGTGSADQGASQDPFGSIFFGTGDRQSGDKRRVITVDKRKKKPKTLFDLLFQ
ncbi:MAG: tetratricopeptide repeat protein [Hyphomicrobiaceae bacterium]